MYVSRSQNTVGAAKRETPMPTPATPAALYSRDRVFLAGGLGYISTEICLRDCDTFQRRHGLEDRGLAW